MTRLTIHKAAQLAQAGIGVRVYPDGSWETTRLDTAESAVTRVKSMIWLQNLAKSVQK